MLRSTLVDPPRVLEGWLARGAAPAQVHLASAGAGPVGGDQFHLEISVGAGSALVLGEVSPSLLLPGPRGEESCTRIDIAVGPGAVLVWLPQLAIAAQGCRHRTDVRAAVAPDARLLLREEVLFGRHGESPGSLSQRVRVDLGDRPLYDQELVAGPEAPGWSGPAVTGGHRSTGNVILVDAELPGGARDGSYRADSASARASLALPGPGTLVSALAADTASLREQLDAALADLLDARPSPSRT